MANEFLYPGILKFCVLGLAFPEESAKEKREGEKKNDFLEQLLKPFTV